MTRAQKAAHLTVLARLHPDTEFAQVWLSNCERWQANDPSWGWLDNKLYKLWREGMGD